MKLPGPLTTAGIFALIVAGWFAFGTLTRTSVATSVEKAEPLFRVVTATIEPQAQQNSLIVYGKSMSEKAVTLLAETTATVRAVPAKEGMSVKRGDALCVLKTDTRNVTLTQAEAALSKATLDLNAAKTLSEKGFQSEAAVAGAQAMYDQAKAAVERAQLDVSNTTLRAPFDGVITAVMVEQGDLLAAGRPCASIADLSSIVMQAEISESELRHVTAGAPAVLNFTDGMSLPGEVSFVSAAAKPGTRSFTIEIEALNTKNIRDGQTVTASIGGETITSYTVPRSALLISDTGITGLRTVTRTSGNLGTIDFVPVTIIGDTAGGVLLTGPEGIIEIVTRGKDYVQSGQTVEIAAPGDTLYGG